MQLLTMSKKNIWLAAVGLFLFSCAVYSQTIFFDFVWDDQSVITFNQNIKSTEAAFKTFYQKSEQPYNAAEFKNAVELTSKNWRPLRNIAHSLIFKLSQFDPFGYHLVNIIFHGLVVVLLLLLLLQMVENLFAALIGALLFAVHPINTEVVCWAKSLEDLMATFFLLITFNLFCRLDFNKTTKRNMVIVLLSIISYALALSAKLSVIFFPIFLLLLIFYRRLDGLRFVQCKTAVKNIFKFDRYSLILSFILMIETVAAIVTRSLIIGHTAQGIYITGNIWTTWLSMPRVFLRYLRIEILPYPLYADYMNYPSAYTLTDPVAWGYAIAFCLIFSLLTWLLYKKKLFEPWLWFWCCLLPFSNIIAMDQLGAERFLYIPTIGFAWLIAAIFKRYTPQNKIETSNRSIKILTFAMIIYCLIFLLLTIQRSTVWSNRLKLWSTTTKQFPHSMRARRNLIITYIILKQPEQALPYIKGLIKEYPQPKNITLYAHLLYMTGEPKQVINALYKHQKSPALNYIAILAAKRKEYANAELAANYACQLQPDSASYDTLNRIALYAAESGECEMAERAIFLASKLGKNDNTINRVGIFAAQQGKLALAERCFSLALKINPNNKKYIRNLHLLQKQRKLMHK